MWAVVYRIETGQNGASRVANWSYVLEGFATLQVARLTYVLDTLPPHHLMEDLSALHTDKAVVHFRLLSKWL